MPKRSGAKGSRPGQPIDSFLDALNASAPRPVAGGQADKKNYAERLSRNIATLVANALRPHFLGITPDDSGRQQESPARTAKGLKKLDVNYSTPQLGLGLGVSIKTINFPDPKSQRYTKNYTRVDNELRAEATDYHQRQPYAVLAAILFLPDDSCDDAAAAPRTEQGASSFGAAVRHFRPRTNRRLPKNDIDLFERFFIGLYELDGRVDYFDVSCPPPQRRRPRPSEPLTFEQTIQQIVLAYDERNNPPFKWAPE